MNDMRLPGIGPFSADALANSGSEPSRDPAQAFDAVMSRFAGDRQRPASAPAKEKAPESRENQGPKAKPAEQARPADKPANDNNADTTTANGKPVGRTKADGADDTGDKPAADTAAGAAPAITDATVLAAMAAAAANAAQTLAKVVPQGDGATPTAAKDAKTAATAATRTLDVLAGQVTAGRNGDKPATDSRVAIGEDSETAAAGTSAAAKKAPVAAKDTLRIEAPPVRAMEVVQAEVAARSTGGAGAFARASPLTANTQDTSPSVMTAAIAAATQTQTTTGTYSIAHAAVAAPVGSTTFADELSQKVVMFAGQKVQRADIAVTPADLGPIAVSIEVRGQEATLAFAAASQTTRAAIEDALPKLRDMLSAQGLHLAGTHVGSESRRDSYRPATGNAGSGGAQRSNNGVAAVAAADTPAIRRRVNLIDIEV